VNTTEICVRSDVMRGDVGVDAFAIDAFATDAFATDAFIPADSAIDTAVDAGRPECLTGTPAGMVSTSVQAALGLGSLSSVASLELVVGATPALIPYSEPLALALEGTQAWIVSSIDNSVESADRSHDRLLWNVPNIFLAASTVAFDIADPLFNGLNNVYSADVMLSGGGLSSLFVRLDPRDSPADSNVLFYRILNEGPPLRAISINDTSTAIFPSGALFSGLAPVGVDDSVIGIVQQDSGSEELADTLFLIPGTAPAASGRNLALGGRWPTPVPLAGTQGALAALNRTTGQVRVLHPDSSGRALPTAWAWTGDLGASAIDITGIPSMPNDFILASFSGCGHVLLTHLDCSAITTCSVRTQVQVDVEWSLREVLITPVGSGYALVYADNTAELVWLDSALRIVGPRAQLFGNTLTPAVPPFVLEHVAIASGSAGLMGVAIYRNVEPGRENQALYARSGFSITP